MLHRLKHLIHRFRPAQPLGVPSAEGFATRGRRWDPSSVEAPWFERPGARERAGEVARRYGLGEQGEAWLTKWIDDGYFVVPGAVDAAAVARYAEEFDRVWWADRPIPGLVVSDVWFDGVRHIHMPHAQLLAYSVEQRREAYRISSWRVGEFYQSSEAADNVFRDARLERICSAILDTRARPHFSLSFSKGSEQPLHQDTCVFHAWPRNALVGVWIAAEDISPASGPLEFYPGSHREPLFPAFTNYPQTQRRTAPPKLADEYDDYVKALATKYPKHVYIAKAGDALFWHGMLIHGGARVDDPSTTRKSMVIHYLPRGANRGHQIEGPFNW
jgi:hypothetical protein